VLMASVNAHPITTRAEMSAENVQKDVKHAIKSPEALFLSAQRVFTTVLWSAAHVSPSKATYGFLLLLSIRLLLI